MTFFTAGGTIASDILRRETRSGVLAAFRLESSQPRNGRLWIDVECWGHLAGTLAQHGKHGRAVLITGRPTLKTWTTSQSNSVRRRLVITANDVELLGSSWPPGNVGLQNTFVGSGVVSTEPLSRPSGDGTVTAFQLAAGRAGSKTGRLWIDVEYWSRAEACHLLRGDAVAVRGRLAYRNVADASDKRGGFVVKARDVVQLLDQPCER